MLKRRRGLCPSKPNRWPSVSASPGGTVCCIFRARTIRSGLQGLSVVDAGMSTISAKGNIYHLTRVEDFPGTFTAVEAGIALGGGAGAQAMENQYGVVMELTSMKAGVKVKLAGKGLKLQMK